MICTPTGGGEFHCVGLAQNHGTFATGHANAGGIAALAQPLVDGAVMGGGHVGGVDHVLHAQWQAVQHAALVGLVEFPGAGARPSGRGSRLD